MDRDIELLCVPSVAMYSRLSLPELKCTCSLAPPASGSWKHQCSLTDGVTPPARVGGDRRRGSYAAARRRSQMASNPNIRTSSTESDQVVLPGSMQLRHRFSTSDSTGGAPGGFCRSLDDPSGQFLDLPGGAYERSASCDEPLQTVCSGTATAGLTTQQANVAPQYGLVLPPSDERVNGNNRLVAVDSDDVFRRDSICRNKPRLAARSFYHPSDVPLDLGCSMHCDPSPRRSHSSEAPLFDIRRANMSLVATSFGAADPLRCVTNSGDMSLVTLDIPDACDGDNAACSVRRPKRASQTFHDVPTLIIVGETPSTNGNGKDAEDIV